jgi:hypothetical protein
MSLNYLIKVLFFLLWFTNCSKKSKIQIVPISPYYEYAIYNYSDSAENRKSKILFLAVKSSSLGKKNLISELFKYIIDNYHKELDTIRPATIFHYYKYKIGSIDEKFINDFNDEHKNIFQIAEPIYSFQWGVDGFLYVERFTNGKVELLDSTGKKINMKGEVLIKEIKDSK